MTHLKTQVISSPFLTVIRTQKRASYRQKRVQLTSESERHKLLAPSSRSAHQIFRRWIRVFRKLSHDSLEDMQWILFSPFIELIFNFLCHYYFTLRNYRNGIFLEFSLQDAQQLCPQGRVYSWEGYAGIKYISYHKNLCLLQGEIAWNCGKLSGLLRSLMLWLLLLEYNSWRTHLGCFVVRVIIRGSAGNWVTLKCYCVAALNSESQLNHFWVCDLREFI